MSPSDTDSDGDAPAQRASGASPGASPDASSDVGEASDLASELQFFQDEASALVQGQAAADSAAAAPLLYAIGVLHESSVATEDVGPGQNQAAVTAYQDAFRSDPTFVAAWWPLRRLLSARKDWAALLTLLDVQVANRRLPPAERAEACVARGRLLEDKLRRSGDAAASYRSALQIQPGFAPALLALLALSSRLRDQSGVEAAIIGIVEIVGPRPETSIALLAQLEQLARTHEAPRARLAALDVLIHTVQQEPGGAPERMATLAALQREKAAVLRDKLFEPRAAFEALREALRFAPAHPLIAEELMDAGAELGRSDVADEIIAAVSAAGTTTEHPVAAVAGVVRETVLRQVAMLGVEDRAAEALALLDAHAPLLGGEMRAAAVRAVLLAQQNDVKGLVAAFTDEGDRQEGVAGAFAFVRAGALAEWVIGDGDRAEQLYRRALERVPGYRPAINPLEARLRLAGRSAELAALWEGELAALSEKDRPSRARVMELLQALVVLYRDDPQLGDRKRALDHQRRLLQLASPNAGGLSSDARLEIRGLVRARDLELLHRAAARAGGTQAAETDDGRAEPVLVALASRAGDAATTAALRIEAARVMMASAGDGQRRLAAEQLLTAALPHDETGLAAAQLELLWGNPGGAGPRLQLVTAELGAAERQDRAEVARALRYRLAFQQAAIGSIRDAATTLRPLRDAGDELARAWSWDLARTSPDAELKAALLGESTGASGLLLATDRAEALEAQAPLEAAAMFARVLGETPSSTDAALGGLRCAVAEPSATPRELSSALRALAAAAQVNPHPGDQEVAAVLQREAIMLGAALGQPIALPADDDPAAAPKPGAPPVDVALLRWMAGVRSGDSQLISRSFTALAQAVASSRGPGQEAETAAGVAPLLARASARARLAGGPRAEGATGEPVPDLEQALDAELHGKLGAALDGYGRVLAADPERLEAMEGVRRIAHASGDRLGEARALARLGTMVRGKAAAAAMFMGGALLFEQAGRPDDAIALYWRVLEQQPEDDEAGDRLGVLLTADPGAPGRAAGLDRLLGHKLRRLRPDGAARVPLLLQRALNRLHRLNDRTNAIYDFKRILKIAPEHEDALRELSAVALTDAAPGEAVQLLQRYLAVVRDDALAAQARLDLARAYEALQDIGQAIEVLHQASSVRPGDGQPRQQLSELSLRAGDWRSAVDTLRAWEQTVTEPARKAQLHLRVGALLRDYGSDPRGAAMSFQLAATLDPMGEGAYALIALYEALGDSARRHDVLRGQIIELRRALERDPVDVPRLLRLKDLLEREDAGGRPAAAAQRPTPPGAVPVMQILALFGEVAEAVDTPPPPRPIAGPELDARAFWAQLASPGAAGLLTAIWSHVGEAAARFYPADADALGLTRQTRVTAAAEPRLGWVEASAEVLGLPRLAYHVSARPLSSSDVAGVHVLPVEVPEPALLFDRAALAGGMGARFQFGRALALLQTRASMIERADPEQLRAIFLAARSVALGLGAEAVAAPLGSLVKAFSKTLGRRDKKELAELTTQWEDNPLEVAAWQHAMLRTADRLGLIVSGDVAAALRVIVDFTGQVPIAEQLNENTRAVELLRFALSERYLKLRQQVGLGET